MRELAASRKKNLLARPCFSEYGAETVRLCYWMCVLPTVRSVDCCSYMFPRCCLFRRAGASHSTLNADVLSHLAGRDARISFRCARATATSCAPGNSGASTRVPARQVYTDQADCQDAFIIRHLLTGQEAHINLANAIAPCVAATNISVRAFDPGNIASGCPLPA